MKTPRQLWATLDVYGPPHPAFETESAAKRQATMFERLRVVRYVLATKPKKKKRGAK